MVRPNTMGGGLLTSIWRYVVCERDFSNREQIWIEGAGTSAENNEMRENLKDKEDESYRERLLNYISHLVTKTIPDVLDEEAELLEKFSL